MGHSTTERVFRRAIESIGESDHMGRELFWLAAYPLLPRMEEANDIGKLYHGDVRICMDEL